MLCYLEQYACTMPKNTICDILGESSPCWGQKNTLQSDCAPANAACSFRMPFPWQLGDDGDEESHHNICEFPNAVQLTGCNAILRTENAGLIRFCITGRSRTEFSIGFPSDNCEFKTQ